LITETYKR